MSQAAHIRHLEALIAQVLPYLRDAETWNMTPRQRAEHEALEDAMSMVVHGYPVQRPEPPKSRVRFVIPEELG